MSSQSDYPQDPADETSGAQGAVNEPAAHTPDAPHEPPTYYAPEMQQPPTGHPMSGPSGPMPNQPGAYPPSGAYPSPGAHPPHGAHLPPGSYPQPTGYPQTGSMYPPGQGPYLYPGYPPRQSSIKGGMVGIGVAAGLLALFLAWAIGSAARWGGMTTLGIMFVLLVASAIGLAWRQTRSIGLGMLIAIGAFFITGIGPCIVLFTGAY